MSDSVDVIVVGAGFSGLTAARELSRRNLSVLVLEARDRVGGRTWTDERWGRSLDMGGTWVHSTQPHVWAEISRYGLQTTRSPTARRCGWILGEECRFGDDRRLDELLSRGMDYVADLGGRLFPAPYDPLAATEELARVDHRSVADAMAALDLSPDQHVVADGMWATNFSSTSQRGALTQAARWCALAYGDWRLMFEAIAKLKFAQGTGALLHCIAGDARADVRLSSPVTRIEVRDQRVFAEHADGSAEAPAAIVTVPVNTLTSIDFEPCLTGGRAALADERQASEGSKVWVRVGGSMEPFFGYATSDHPLTLIQYEYEHEGDSLLVAFGSHGATFDGNDRDAVAEAIRPWLPDAHVVDVTEHNWTRDEFSRGTWGMLKPGQLSRHGADLYRQEPPLFFAGSDIARGWAGFIDGAIETGLRTAQEVATHLRGRRPAAASPLTT